MQDDLDMTARAKRKLTVKQEAERALRAEQNDIALLMHERFGRNVMHRALTEARCFHTTFVPSDPHSTSYNEGKRAMGLWLLSQIIQQAPDQYALMMKENTDA